MYKLQKNNRGEEVMKQRIFGKIREKIYNDLKAAMDSAGQEVAATAGYSIPVIVFRQGKERINLTGAFPFSFIASRLEMRSAKKKASISEASSMMNRPVIQEHADVIAEYLKENMKKKYILPPMTLNIQQDTNLYSVDYPSELRPGFLVIPATAKLTITDGQHRRLGIIKALESLTESEAEELQSDSIAVMITCETDIDQIHQDFADCSKTKPLPPSQLAVYDRRNPANRLVLDLERNCQLFHGKVDATSKTLGSKSTSLFLANHIRQLVKTLLVKNWQMSDIDFQKQALNLLSNDDAYEDTLAKFKEYINYLTERMPVWKEISELKSGVSMTIIPERRKEGWVCLSVVGLIILGTIGHELFQKREREWEKYADRLVQIDWKKNGDLWKENIVSKEGKILVQQRLIREATQKVREKIGWDPKLDQPLFSE
jgi:DNA sulfur modification protein DndB